MSGSEIKLPWFDGICRKLIFIISSFWSWCHIFMSIVSYASVYENNVQLMKTMTLIIIFLGLMSLCFIIIRTLPLNIWNPPWKESFFFNVFVIFLWTISFVLKYCTCLSPDKVLRLLFSCTRLYGICDPPLLHIL